MTQDDRTWLNYYHWIVHHVHFDYPIQAYPYQCIEGVESSSYRGWDSSSLSPHSILTLMNSRIIRKWSSIACKTFKFYTSASSNSQYSAQMKPSKIYRHKISFISLCHMSSPKYKVVWKQQIERNDSTHSTKLRCGVVVTWSPSFTLRYIFLPIHSSINL